MSRRNPKSRRNRERRVRRGPRGGPGDLTTRIARAEALFDRCGDDRAALEPLRVLVHVLRHQLRRTDDGALSGATTTEERPAAVAASVPPLVDTPTLVPVVADELTLAVDALQHTVPSPLRQRADTIASMTAAERAAVVEAWFDDVELVEPQLAFWIGTAATPVLESAAQACAAPSDWKGSACPVCGGSPQASVIAEESGEFMAGSPRSLVCGRCATWWSFARATCTHCGDDDSRHLESFIADGHRSVRVDTCATCHRYIKSFDLREPGAGDVVPLVDDVATLTLDVWIQQRGYSRATTSLAGV